MTCELKVVKLSQNATIPTKASQYSTGYDLYAAYDYVIPSWSRMLVKTDIAVQFPEGCYGRIAPRSGLSLKHCIDVGAGVVDSDYTGNLGVILVNLGLVDFIVTRGDRIAQVICEKICYPAIAVVEHLEETTRGASGFGSSGIN